MRGRAGNDPDTDSDTDTDGNSEKADCQPSAGAYALPRETAGLSLTGYPVGVTVG